jgi:hypothetical protein
MLRATCSDPRVGSGRLWDDLGSTQFVETRPHAERNALRGRIIGSSDDDEDELDFLSSGSRSEDVEETSPPRKDKRSAMKGRPRKAVVQEQEPGYRPGYAPKRKLPDFKKVTKPKEAGASTSRNKLSQELPERTKSHQTLSRLSRVSSDSSDCNQATPRAKHSKGRVPEKFPTLDPLFISGPTTHKQASRKAVVKGKVRLNSSSDRGASLVRGDAVSDRTTPRKQSQSSHFPIPSPLSSPSLQYPQSSASSARGTRSLGTSDSEAVEGAVNQTPKQRPLLRPFPMMAASRLENCLRTPRQRISSAQQTLLRDGGNTIASDLEEFEEDDSRQRLPTNMLLALILTIFFKFLLANQRIHQCYALSAMRGFPLTPPLCIAPFSMPPSARPIRIRARVTLKGSKLRWAYMLRRASVIDLRHIRYLRR